MMNKVKRFIKKRKILSVILIIGLISITAVGYNEYQHPEIKLIANHLEYEYGDSIDLVDNLKNDEKDDISWEIEGDLEEVGEHVVSYHYRDTVKTCYVVVKDTT